MINTLRRSARRLVRSPGFTVVAIVSLGAGLGLSTGALALVEGLSKQPDTQIVDIDRISELILNTTTHAVIGNVSALQQMEALRTIPGIDRVTAFQSTNVLIETNGDAVRSYIGRTPLDFFRFLGVKPTMGRLPSEDEVSNGSSVLVSAQYWRRKFAGNTALADAIVVVNDRPYHVSGVLPQGLARVYAWDVWLPFPDQSALATQPAALLIRRRAGVSLAQLAPALDAAANRLAHDRPPGAPRAMFRDLTPRVESFVVNDFLFSLLIAGYGVLLVACVNVAALMLARGLVKRRDYALRLALGATRLSLTADVCSELVVLTIMGVISGGVIAYWSLHALMSQIPEELIVDGFVPPEWNWHVARLASASVILVVAIAGAIPAWRAMQTQPVEPLKESAGTTTGRAETRFHLLLVTEFAISMVLVFSTTLMLRSTHKLSTYDFGYDANKLVLANVSFATVRDSAMLRSGERVINETVERVRAVSGVASAAEFSRNSVEDGQVVSEFDGPVYNPVALHRYWNVGAGFLATLGVPIQEGRDFAEGDRQGHGAVILTRRMARLLFPDGKAIGHMVKLGGSGADDVWLPVVGISRDVDLDNHPGRDVAPEPTIFLSAPDSSARSWSIVVKPSGDAALLSAKLSTTLRAALPARAGTSVTPWLAAFQHQLKQREFVNRIFTGLGVASLLLGAAGVFSVLSYAVGQRMREFAVRVALGATPRDVVWLVVRTGLELTLGGIVLGTVLSVWAGSVIGANLFGVQPNDPASLVGTAILLAGVTVIAALFPAWRAMRVDPVNVLRAI